MDHETSIKTLAAEKYLLGELSPPERELFEQHFFECPECAEDVRVGFELGENARIVFREEASPVSRPARVSKLREWFASLQPRILVTMTACLAIAVFSGYQNAIQIPAIRAHVTQLEQPQVLSTALLAPSSRSSLHSIVIPPGAQFVQLTLAIGTVSPAMRYQCDLRTASGKSITTLPVSSLDPDANLNLLIPVSRLSNGDYEVILSGVTGGTMAELDHYRFALQRK